MSGDTACTVGIWVAGSIAIILGLAVFLYFLRYVLYMMCKVNVCFVAFFFKIDKIVIEIIY